MRRPWGDTISLVWSKAFNVSGLLNQTGKNAPGANNAEGLTTIKVNVNGKDVDKLIFTIGTVSKANNTLANIDAFIQAVDSKRAELGAIQNRMESAIRNQANVAENESDARSRIRDTDFASETAALTQNNIIQQASQSILAQANQRPTIALSLLGQ